MQFDIDNPWVQYFGIPLEHKVKGKIPIDTNVRKTPMVIQKSEHIMSVNWYAEKKQFGSAWWAFFTNKQCD